MSILAKYVDTILTPTDKQKQFIKRNVRAIKMVLTQNSSLTPKESHTGGSLAKGTMLKHKLDADLVFAYNRSEEVGKDWQKLSSTIYDVLISNFSKIEIEEAGNLAIHIKTKLDDQPVNFDVVPCYYINSPKKMKDHTDSKLYTGITTIWHTRYLVRYKNFPYFTHIVRLLKDWKREQDVPFLKSLHLELIVADVYNNVIEGIDGIRGIDEVLMYCFENIVNTLDGFPVIPSHWRYCNEKNYEERYDSPVLIDPANPSDNLLDGIEKDIKKIRIKTKISMKNLAERNYSAIFNRKGQTDFFD